MDKTFWDYLQEYEEAKPNQIFLIDKEKKLTVFEAKKRILGLVAFFWKQGIRTGDYVALHTAASIDMIQLFFALQVIGVKTVLTDTHKKTEEFLKEHAALIPIKGVLSNEEKTWCIEMRDCCSGNSKKRILIPLHESFTDNSGENIFLKKWLLHDSRTPTIIIFTSGSTGKSKSVMLSQYNFVNNLEDTRTLGGYSRDDIALGFLPLNHVFGLALLCGALVLQHTFAVATGIEAERLLADVERYKITRMNGIPELFLQMAQKAEGYDLSSLRVGLIGGSPSTPKQFMEIEEKLRICLIPVYGMSECIGISCGSWKDTQKLRMSGVGRFYSMNDGKVQKEDGSYAGIDEEGEIIVKGPAQMSGYFEEEDNNVDDCGYLHTGDIGYVDKRGILHVTGRKKEIIIRNGLNLSVRKIEERLLELDEIEEAAVIGVPSERYGEVPWAVLVCRDSRLDEECLRHIFLNEKRMSYAELPEKFIFVEKMPRTESGKTDKASIREMLANGVDFSI